MAICAMGIIPPLIRQTLIKDRSFRERYDLKTETIVSFESNSISIQWSKFYAAARTVFTGGSPTELTDSDNRTWSLSNDARDDDEFPRLVLSSDEQRLILPDFAVLSDEPFTRLRSLRTAVSDVNLPRTAEEKWRNILEERALNDDEFNTYQSDLRDTPVHVEKNIASEIAAGETAISSLVPNSLRYFERLVGKYDGSSSIREYAMGAGHEAFKQLREWRPYEGFLFSLLLSSHSALTAQMEVASLDQKHLESAFDYLERHGDILSLLGALEVGLRVLPDRPEIKPFLLRILNRIRDDDSDEKNSEFYLFSSLFILVDGELARTRLMAQRPPFYRRLASLAQAALIHRQVLHSKIDRQSLSDWASSCRFEHYYMQSLADMRVEPRWSPDLAAASQIRADFIGRILIVGNTFKGNIEEGELCDVIFGDGERSLIKLCEFPRPYFPGPLEGAENSENHLPDDLCRIIEENLNASQVGASSFTALVNSAMIFKITAAHAELATTALRLGNHTLSNLEDKAQLVGTLSGLAIVAAVSRNTALADELRILVRRYRRPSQYCITIEEAMKICLVASAAREDLIDWRKSVGECLTELAFGDLEGSQGRSFHSLLLALLHSAPELWVSCARADAALRAWCSR